MVQTNLKDPVNHFSWSQKILDISFDFFCSVGPFGSEKGPDVMHYSWSKMGFNSFPSTSTSLGMKGAGF